MDGGFQPGAWLFLAALLCAALCAILSAFETSFTRCDRLKVKSKANRGDAACIRISKYLDDYEKTISSVLILMNVAHASYAAIFTFFFSRVFASHTLAIGVLISGFSLFILAEMLPKLVAMLLPRTVLYASSRLCAPLFVAVSPFAEILRKVSVLIMRPFSKGMRDENAISEEDIKSMTQSAVESGLIDSDTKTIVEQALSFDDKTAGSVMTGWDDVVRICLSSKGCGEGGDVICVSDACDLIRCMDDLKFTRYPAVDSDGRLLGVLNTRIFLQDYLRNGMRQDIRECLLLPFYLDASAKTDDCLVLLSRNRTHLGFVRGSDGQVMGIVTMEDITEELIGDVDDEKTIRGRL